MKNMRLILGVFLALCAGAVSAQAHGHWHGGFGWPFWSFGIGLSFPIYSSYSYPAYAYSYPAYTYTYTQPAYTYSRPASSVPQPTAAPDPPAATLAPAWVPSTPGTGQWVPDSTPYRYTAEVTTTAPVPAVPARSVTVTTSLAGMPIYRISR